MKKVVNQESFVKINGRPKKYKTEEERKEVRRNQNRLNQIACRKRKRIKMLELMTFLLRRVMKTSI